jgi:hypothetical protein
MLPLRMVLSQNLLWLNDKTLLLSLYLKLMGKRCVA